jgi:hypothetical protein
VWPEGLGQLKKFIHQIRSRNHDLPACSIVPQQYEYSRAMHAGLLLGPHEARQGLVSSSVPYWDLQMLEQNTEDAR